jgi:hypothetical protein
LVSFDPDVQQNAKRLGIPRFKDVNEIDEARWKIPRSSKARQRVPRKKPRSRAEIILPRSIPENPSNIYNQWGRIGLFFLGILAVVLLSAAIAPSATIRVQPERFTQTIWIRLPVDPAQSEIGTDSVLPIQIVTVPVSAEARTLTTGRQRFPDQHAEGTVVFTNLQSQEIDIPTGTGIRASSAEGVRFETIESVQLDPGIGSTIAVPIRSLTAGEDGNLEAGMIDSVEGELGLSVQVSNPEAIQGGGSSTKSAVVDKDLKQLADSVQEDLIQLAEDEIVSTLREDQRLLHQSLQIEQILESTPDRDVGELAESVGLRQEAMVSGWVYNTTELETLLKSIAEKRLPTNALIFPLTFRILEVEEILSSSGDLDHLSIRIQQQWTNEVNEGELVRRLRGASVEEVDQIIEQELGMAGQLELEVKPRWFPLLPLMPARYVFILEGF